MILISFHFDIKILKKVSEKRITIWSRYITIISLVYSTRLKEVGAGLSDYGEGNLYSIDVDRSSVVDETDLWV